MPKTKLNSDSNVAVADKTSEETKTEESSSEGKKNFVSKSKKDLAMDKMRPFIEEETKLVKGRFRNYETPGGHASVFCSKYPGVEPFKKTMFDGEVYEVPLYVARFLNGVDVTAKGCDEKINTCAYPVHAYKHDRNAPMVRSDQDVSGNIILPDTLKKWTRRYGFESLEFDKAI